MTAHPNCSPSSCEQLKPQTTLDEVHIPRLQVEPNAVVLEGPHVDEVPVGVAVQGGPRQGVPEVVVVLVQGRRGRAARRPGARVCRETKARLSSHRATMKEITGSRGVEKRSMYGVEMSDFGNVFGLCCPTLDRWVYQTQS